MEVGGDTNRGPVLAGLEGHSVDASNELVRGIQKSSHASVRVGDAVKPNAHPNTHRERREREGEQLNHNIVSSWLVSFVLCLLNHNAPI